MSDREFGGNDDLSLPKATVQKIVTEILQSEPGMTFAKDSRDLLIECCVEFITLISSEANEIAEKDAKKTIACEHVKQALEELDFHDYVPAILEVAADYKKQQQVRAYTIKATLQTLFIGQITPGYMIHNWLQMLCGCFLSHLECIADTSQNREKKQTKIEQSGMTEEELIRAQEELFRNATNKFHSEPTS
ncbi:histone-fold-containing protein [Karstenula rhodostoma CBS 690.94]|uniref:NCT transcriptional regulatory complex subunit B n=1 Tax=Karstenula rhodostoma CBS 690.94 TaxID=1392251 RepID=A0A9P4PL19_9PLEO|nr:histone-fold-containing protein [Karstenula rhodostoma CBS 690.94]